MAISDKDREEIRQTIAQVLAQSIIGRVEHIITDALSGKVGHLQTAQREAEEKAEQARKETTGFIERGVQAEKQLEEQKKQLAAEQKTAADATKVRDMLRAQAEARLAEIKEAGIQAAKEAEEKVEAARKEAEEKILEYQRAIDVKKKELDSMEKAAARYKKAVEVLDQ